MIYNFKEYKLIFDTPTKREQEMAIVNKIIDLLNKNKYDNLEEFIVKNNTYETFLKNNNLDNVVKHFGNTLNDIDFKNILENLRKLTKDKQSFKIDTIKTTIIDDKEYNSFKGKDKTYFIDNSNTNKSIEEQMKELQHTEQTFQTPNAEINTENMFKEFEKTKKESLKLSYLSSIQTEDLNNIEYELFNVALNYQLNTNQIIRIDLQKGVIVDEQDNIMKIEKENGQYTIIKDENGIDKDVTPEKTTSYQKQLKYNL